MRLMSQRLSSSSVPAERIDRVFHFVVSQLQFEAAATVVGLVGAKPVTCRDDCRFHQRAPEGCGAVRRCPPYLLFERRGDTGLLRVLRLMAAATI